jgi:uncharacterized protein (TIGR00730 family)
MAIRSVCVFCGARVGTDPVFARTAREAAAAIADRGLRLVYGGGNVGMMGVLADEALARGVHVTGVIPRSMVDVELAHAGIENLIVVNSMHERKAVMARECDAILALPGGVGTLDELFEAMTWNQLGLQRKPIGLLDVPLADGTFYQGLLAFLRQAMGFGLVKPGTLDLMATGMEVGTLLDHMGELASRPRA